MSRSSDAETKETQRAARDILKQHTHALKHGHIHTHTRIQGIFTTQRFGTRILVRVLRGSLDMQMFGIS